MEANKVFRESLEKLTREKSNANAIYSMRYLSSGEIFTYCPIKRAIILLYEKILLVAEDKFLSKF